MKNDYFKDIYNDFFSVESKEIKVPEKKEEESTYLSIDDLYLDNESKNLLKQIIEYMDKYSKKEETNYINFNIIVDGNNTITVDGISSILHKSVASNHYTDNNSVYNLSLYDLNNKVDINDIYSKNGIIVIKDFDTFSSFFLSVKSI